jgi:hypothetical protein
VDISALASFLAPVLPYLVRAGRDAAEQAANRFGENAWGYAKQLWERLRPKVEQEPRAESAVQDVVEAPDDERARGSLELQLERLLEADPGLAADVLRLWRDARQADAVRGDIVIVHGHASVGVGGNVGGSITTSYVGGRDAGHAEPRDPPPPAADHPGS